MVEQDHAAASRLVPGLCRRRRRVPADVMSINLPARCTRLSYFSCLLLRCAGLLQQTFASADFVVKLCATRHMLLRALPTID